MEFNLRSRWRIAELTVSDGNTKITEDIADHNGKIPKGFIDDVLNLAIELNRHNDESDLDLIYNLYDSQLTHSERELFKERIENE